MVPDTKWLGTLSWKTFGPASTNDILGLIYLARPPSLNSPSILHSLLYFLIRLVLLEGLKMCHRARYSLLERHLRSVPQLFDCSLAADGAVAGHDGQAAAGELRGLELVEGGQQGGEHALQEQGYQVQGQPGEADTGAAVAQGLQHVPYEAPEGGGLPVGDEVGFAGDG